MKKCFIIFSLLFIFSSCSDDPIISEQENNNSVEHAQKWFEKNINISSSSNGRISSRPKNVSWENGISYVKDITQTVEVPIQYETELIAYPQSINKNASYKNLTKLLMFEDGKGAYNIFVMRIMPDIASVLELEKNTYNKKLNSFTGDIIYYTWDGQPIVYTRYESGKRIEWNSILQVSKKEDTGGARITNDCYSIEVEYYSIACSGNYCGEPNYLYSDYYYFCSGPNYDEDTDGYSGDLGGGNDYGDNSGSSDSGTYSEAYIWENDKICLTQNFKDNNCVSNAWNKLKAQNTAFKFLKNFLAENPAANLCMDVVSSLPNSETGGTTTQTNNEILIRINSSVANSQPDIVTALILIHELIHAEMFRKIKSVNNQLTIDNFPGLFDYYSRYEKLPDGNGGWHYPNGSPQHNLMANHYISIMADALMEFDGAATNKSLYEALAWQGLTETEIWGLKSESEKNNIKSLRQTLLSNRSKCQ